MAPKPSFSIGTHALNNIELVSYQDMLKHLFVHILSWEDLRFAIKIFLKFSFILIYMSKLNILYMLYVSLDDNENVEVTEERLDLKVSTA